MRVGASLAVALLGLAALTGCGDDDDTAVPPADPLPELPHTSPEAEAGGVEVPEIPGTFPAPVPSLGFGIAVPQGWNATLLSDEALERVEQADLVEPFFLDAARTVARGGAVFYAAGIDDEGRVAEIKVDVQEGAETDPEGLRTQAQAAAEAAGGTDISVVDGDGGRVRVDFRLDQVSADDGEPIEAYASQLFVPEGDRVWSIVVTSEDAGTQDAVLAIVDAGFVVA